MTVYVGDVKIQAAALSAALNQVEDLDEATQSELTGMRIVAHATSMAVDIRVAELDTQLAGDELSIAGVAAGTFSLDAIVAINSLSASLDQMNGLLDCRAYAGRIEANLKQATGGAA